MEHWFSVSHISAPHLRPQRYGSEISSFSRRGTREASLGNTDNSVNVRFLIHLTSASFSRASRARNNEGTPQRVLKYLNVIAGWMGGTSFRQYPRRSENNARRTTGNVERHPRMVATPSPASRNSTCCNARVAWRYAIIARARLCEVTRVRAGPVRVEHQDPSWKGRLSHFRKFATARRFREREREEK